MPRATLPPAGHILASCGDPAPRLAFTPWPAMALPRAARRLRAHRKARWRSTGRSSTAPAPRSSRPAKSRHSARSPACSLAEATTSSTTTCPSSLACASPAASRLRRPRCLASTPPRLPDCTAARGYATVEARPEPYDFYRPPRRRPRRRRHLRLRPPPPPAPSSPGPAAAPSSPASSPTCSRLPHGPRPRRRRRRQVRRPHPPRPRPQPPDDEVEDAPCCVPDPACAPPP
jgi:hypothetical protein